MVQLDIGTKRKINEIIKGYTVDIDGVNTMEYLNIIPLGSYDVPIEMDWLYVHHVILCWRWHNCITNFLLIKFGYSNQGFP